MKMTDKRFLNFGLRTLILIAALVVLLGGAVSSTAAWMFIKSNSLKNTFSYGDIKIQLTESDTELDGDEDDDTNAYSLKPDTEIAKDPKVTVGAGTIDCWVFVEVVKSDNFDEYLEYTVADGWSRLEEEEGIYYREVRTSDENQTFDILKGNVVKVKDGVTQQMLDAMEAEDYPQIMFTAYAVQLVGLDDAREAWEAIAGKSSGK